MTEIKQVLGGRIMRFPMVVPLKRYSHIKILLANSLFVLAMHRIRAQNEACF